MRSLYVRLGTVLLFLFVMLAVVFLLTLSHLSGTYLDEQTQKTQGMVAAYIAREHHSIGPDVLDVTAMESLFAYVAIVNPVTQAYLLDRNGIVIAQSNHRNTPGTHRVSLAPIRRFLSGAPLPIEGDDPNHTERQRIFSAAPIANNGVVLGYVYVTLHGSNPLNLRELWSDGQSFKLAILMIVVCLTFALMTGLLLFRALTNRLKNLTRSVEDFKERQYSEQLRIPPFDRNGDEIDRLTEVFADMAHRIADQIRNLERVDHARRMSISNASHDLRTPLTSMQGYLETLILKGGTLDEEHRLRYLHIAHKHSTRLQTLVSEMYELARLDSPDLIMQPETFPLDELVADVVQKFQLGAHQKSIALKTDVPERSCFVLADVAMLERVFENLLGNSLRHTAVGGQITISLNIVVDKISVVVDDDGEGISPEIAEHVFERHVAGQHQNQRSGLGLAIVKRILELHQSDISLNTNEGRGTRIGFYLPVATPDSVA